jgi:hypothetical protein
MDLWIGMVPFSETQCIEFLFLIIDYIINKFLLFLFDVSSNSGIICCRLFVFDEMYLFVIDNFMYIVFHSHD